MRRNGIDLRAHQADLFLIPMKGSAGAMAPTIAQKIDGIVAEQTITRRKRGVRRALAKAPPITPPDQDQREEIRNTQIAMIKSLRGVWDMISESTQELLLAAVEGLHTGRVAHRDYVAAIQAARLEAKGPSTPAPRYNNFAAGYWPSGSGW